MKPTLNFFRDYVGNGSVGSANQIGGRKDQLLPAHAGTD